MERRIIEALRTCENLEIISDKNKRVQSRACALIRRTTTVGRTVYRKFRLNERLAPARQLYTSARRLTLGLLIFVRNGFKIFIFTLYLLLFDV